MRRGGVCVIDNTRLIDLILYNRRAWRRQVEAMEPRTSTSVVTLPVSSAAGDPVGRVVVDRVTVLRVLDIVDAALAGLPSENRRIALLKWEDQASHRRIAERLHYCERTIERRVKNIRRVVYAALAAGGYEKLSAFCRDFVGILSGWGP